MKKIVIACDHGAVDLKNEIVAFLKKKDFDVTDLGTHGSAAVDYPDMALAACNELKKGGYEFGILLCGTGIGMAISANKVPGIRAAQAHDTYSAERASRSNDAHIVSIGARVVGIELAKSIVHAFLTSTFDGGRSQPKIDALRMHEKRLTAH